MHTITEGVLFFKLGQYQQAIVDFNKAISLKPDFVDAHHNRNLALNEIAKHARMLQIKDKDTAVDF